MLDTHHAGRALAAWERQLMGAALHQRRALRQSDNMIGSVTTETFVIIICSILGALLVVVVALFIYLVMKRKRAVNPYNEQYQLQQAASMAAIRAADQLEKHNRLRVGHQDLGAGGPEGPHPALLQQQLKYEFLAQQQQFQAVKQQQGLEQLAQSDAGPAIDAARLAQRLISVGQNDAAMAVATAAGIKHLIPGVMPVPVAVNAAAAPPSRLAQPGVYASNLPSSPLPPGHSAAGGAAPIQHPWDLPYSTQPAAYAGQPLATYPVQYPASSGAPRISAPLPSFAAAGSPGRYVGQPAGGSPGQQVAGMTAQGLIAAAPPPQQAGAALPAPEAATSLAPPVQSSQQIASSRRQPPNPSPTMFL